MKVNLLAILFENGEDPDGAKAQLARANPDAVVQVIRGKGLSNSLVLELLAAQTMGAMEGGGLLARRPEVDFLLRVAGTAQISRAIASSGAVKGQPFILVAFTRGTPIGGTPAGAKTVPRRGLSTAEKFVVEKGALLSAQRT